MKANQDGTATELSKQHSFVARRLITCRPIPHVVRRSGRPNKAPDMRSRWRAADNQMIVPSDNSCPTGEYSQEGSGEPPRHKDRDAGENQTSEYRIQSGGGCYE